MPYDSLRDFIARLESTGRLKRVTVPVDPELEATEIQTRLIAEGGPAVIFEKPVNRRTGKAYKHPMLVNLFGTVERVAWGMDRAPDQLRQVGETLAFLKQPEPPGGWKEALEMLPLVKRSTGWFLSPMPTGGTRGAEARVSPKGAGGAPSSILLRDWPTTSGRAPGRCELDGLPMAETASTAGLTPMSIGLGAWPSALVSEPIDATWVPESGRASGSGA